MTAEEVLERFPAETVNERLKDVVGRVRLEVRKSQLDWLHPFLVCCLADSDDEENDSAVLIDLGLERESGAWFDQTDVMNAFEGAAKTMLTGSDWKMSEPGGRFVCPSELDIRNLKRKEKRTKGYLWAVFAVGHSRMKRGLDPEAPEPHEEDYEEVIRIVGMTEDRRIAGAWFWVETRAARNNTMVLSLPTYVECSDEKDYADFLHPNLDAFWAAYKEGLAKQEKERDDEVQHGKETAKDT